MIDSLKIDRAYLILGGSQVGKSTILHLFNGSKSLQSYENEKRDISLKVNDDKELPEIIGKSGAYDNF